MHHAIENSASAFGSTTYCAEQTEPVLWAQSNERWGSDMVDTGLRGKVVLVTGANNPYGIGAAVARACAEQGAKIFLHYFRALPSITDNQQKPEIDVPGVAFYFSQQVKSADQVLTDIRRFNVDACPSPKFVRQ
jgi:hypothetical protein